MTVEIRPFAAGDVDAMEAFLGRIAPGEAAFFKDDVSDPRTAAQWTADRDAGHRLVAIDEDDRIVGYAAVVPGIGWSSHVGDVRLFVDAEQRRNGIGRDLARRVLSEALRMGLRKVVVEVVADQRAAVAMFTAIGFVPEALLVDQIADRDGEYRDLMLLAHHVAAVASSMATLGISDELA